MASTWQNAIWELIGTLMIFAFEAKQYRLGFRVPHIVNLRRCQDFTKPE